MGSGRVSEVLGSNRLLEAPNWLPDATGLLVNCEGALFQVPLKEPALNPVETPGLARLNNDHGPSPDGKWLAVSNHTVPGKSCIYIQPLNGKGPVKQVTQNTPSWWHGWSPDARRLTYTALRDGQFCIATCQIDGSDEQVLITSQHHYDGPDYTPDGRWIWFNSNRGGSMQLWRIRPDGCGAEAMTSRASVNWFPHPCPDNKTVLYLAYPDGTEGHPRNRQVELCLYDIATRRCTKLLELFGGQGTINVPCWSPDGSSFAFVRYSQAETAKDQT